MRFSLCLVVSLCSFACSAWQKDVKTAEADACAAHLKVSPLVQKYADLIGKDVDTFIQDLCVSAGEADAGSK